MSTSEKKPRQMPKGGRKGGAMFPRMSLGDMLMFAKKLVSKTHTAAQPTDVILMGVFGSRHEKGKYGMSAAKQYGLMAGDGKTNYSATDLAKRISAAPSEEQPLLCRQAALKPAIFKSLFETFHGDTVSKARLKQRAADLNVHPDETAACVELYVSSMLTAGLASVEGDQVTHLASSDLVMGPATGGSTVAATVETGAEEVASDPNSAEGTETGFDLSGAGRATQAEAGDDLPAKRSGTGQVGPRAVFNVNVTLDSSLDIEKLQKQLELLKRYGAL